MGLNNFTTANSDEDDRNRDGKKIDARYRDKEWLKEQCEELDRSDRDISEECKVTPGTICKWRSKFNVESGSSSKYKENKSESLSQYHIDVINSVLLGDGNLSDGSSGSPRLTVTDKNEEYLDYIKSLLPKRLFTENCMQEQESENGKWNYLYTRKSKEFKPLKEQWYDTDKTLPKDMCFKSIHLLHLYIDDGSLNSNNQPSIELYWLEQQEAELLKKQMCSLGLDIKLSSWGNNGRFTFQPETYDIDKFFKIIGSCPIECYNYKWTIKHR